jgi:branched-chain amino acid transport system substrate-binding protein
LLDEGPRNSLRGSLLLGVASLRRAALLFATLIVIASPAAADIQVGVAGPMAGQFAVFGNQMKTGVEAAVADVNAAGGINGEKLAVIVADDGCDTKKAVEVAKDFIAKDVRLVVGHFCSGASLAAALLYQAAGIVMITPSASQPALTEKALWNVFRTTGRDDAQAALAATRLAAANPTANIGVVSDTAPTNVLLAERFMAVQGKAIRFSVKTGAGNFADVTAGVSINALAAIYLALAPGDAGRLAAELRTKGFTGQIAGPDSLLGEVFWTRATVAGEGAIATFPADPVSLVTAIPVVNALRIKESDPEGASLPSYAAVQVYVAATKARPVNNSRAIADWLRSGEAITTVLGQLKFDTKGDLQDQPYIWYRWNNGAFAPEKP